LGFPYNISATAAASDFKFGKQLGFVKAHHKITRNRKGGHGPGQRELSKIGGSPSIFSQWVNLATDTQLGFAKAHHEITPRGKSGGGFGLGELLKILGLPYNISETAGLAISSLAST